MSNVLLVFAYNRCNSDMFCLEQIQDMAQVTHKFFAHSRLKTRGDQFCIFNVHIRRETFQFQFSYFCYYEDSNVKYYKCQISN